MIFSFKCTTCFVSQDQAVVLLQTNESFVVRTQITLHTLSICSLGVGISARITQPLYNEEVEERPTNGKVRSVLFQDKQDEPAQSTKVNS